MEEYQDRSLGGRVFKRLREDILLADSGNISTFIRYNRHKTF